MAGKVPENVNLSISRLGNRYFQTSSMWRSIPDANKSGSEVGPAKVAPKTASHTSFMGPGGPRGAPTALDKRFLVWSGVYKSTAEIPSMLDGDVIHRARSWGRIRINIGFLFIAAIGGGISVYLGKTAAARGESVEKRNIEWHRKIKEDHEKSIQAQK